MSMTYATIAGKVTKPGSDIGIRVRLTATPLTTHGMLTFEDDDRLTVGPEPVETNSAGVVPTWKIPTNVDIDGLVWRITAERLDNVPGVPKRWTVKNAVEITGTDTLQLRDLAEVDVLTVDAQLVIDLTDLVNDAEDARDDAESAALDAEAAEAASASSATAAASSATAAAGSATSASGSASTATTQAGNALVSATAADASADAAAASAAHAEDMAGAAEAVAVSNDTIIAGRINDATSLASAALRTRVKTIMAGPPVFLFVGQSNVKGADNTKDPAIDVADPRIFEYACSGPNAGTIQPAVDPLHHIEGVAVDVGPAIPFARKYLSYVNPQVNEGDAVVVVPFGWGGIGMRATSTPGVYWRPDFVPGPGERNLYLEAIAATNDALTKAGPGAWLAGIIWCQGEADGSTSGATYQADLLALIDGFRANITGASNTPFAILSMVPEQITSGNAGRVTINNVHVDTPYLRELTGYAYGLSGHAVGSGGIHYDAVAQRHNGSVALAVAFQRALSNVKGTAPNPPTRVRVARNATPTTVDVTWDAPLGRVTDYTVQYRTADGEAWTTLTRTRSLAASAQITGLTLGNFVEVQVLTVNENGTSDPSTSVKLAMLPEPSLSVVQSAADSVLLTTDAVLGATGYRFDYKLSASSTWTLGTVQAGLTKTISGLSTSAYDFREVAFTPLGAVVVTATSYTLAPVPIDTSSLTASIAAGYGLRKVILGTSANAIRVRRSSDNTEQNIGFNGNELDVAALLAFAGSGDAFVKTLYDQTANARDFTQTTAAAQPKIVSAGVLVTHNGRPAMQFDGVDDYLMRSTAELWAAGACTVCGVSSGTPSTNLQECILGEGGTGSNNARYMILKGTTGVAAAKFGYNIIGDASSSDVLSNEFTDGSTGDTFGTTVRQWSFLDSGSAITRYRGGTVIPPALGGTSNSYSRSGKTLTLNRQAIGALIRTGVTTFANIKVSELVIFHAAAGTSDRQAVELNQKTFYGTPAGL